LFAKNFAVVVICLIFARTPDFSSFYFPFWSKTNWKNNTFAATVYLKEESKAEALVRKII